MQNYQKALAGAALAVMLAGGTASAQPQPANMTPLATIAQSGEGVLTDVHYRRRYGGYCSWHKRCWWNHWGHRRCTWVRRCR